MCACMCVCTFVCRCLQRSEIFDAPVPGVIVVVSHPVWMLGTAFESFASTELALTAQPIASASNATLM